jgi:hypothetical protein
MPPFDVGISLTAVTLREQLEIGSATDYLHWLAALLVSAHTDAWAVDRAYAMLQLGLRHRLSSSSLAQQPKFAAYFASSLIQLAERIHVAKLPAEARFTLDCASALAEAERTGRYLRIPFANAKAVLDGTRKLRPRIMHPCQEENLIRLKIIEEDRHKGERARLQEALAQDRSADLRLRLFQEQGGFILLSHDIPFRCEPSGKQLVPMPRLFCDRIELLPIDQRAEYFRVFGPSASRVELKRYFYIRVTSYLCSLVESFSDREADTIERECKLLQELLPDRAMYFDPVLGVSRHLRHLDPATRDEKLELLQRLDSPTPVMSLSGKAPGDPSTRIEPTQVYLSVVTAPLDRLRMALRTGSIYTKEELGQNTLERRRDIALVRELQENAIAAKAWDVELHHRNEQEKVVEAFEPHIRQLLAAANKIAPEHTVWLEPAWWIEGMTAALARLKRWDEAKSWLELFLNLDPRCQGKFSEAQKRKMLKRLARCKARSDS